MTAQNSKLQAMLAAAQQAAETGPDMTQVEKGGGGARLLPEGYAFGRLVEYVEFGNQPQEYGGVSKPAAPEFQLGFALTGEGYANEDGTPYILRTWPLAMSRNEKARTFLLFKALNWKGAATHFAQLLGEGFLVKIETYKPKTADAKPRSAIDLKGFLPPLDPVSKRPYPIDPVRDEDLRLFLWDYPSIEAWDALFIDGAWEDGRTKNVLQEKCLSATNFSGSALENMLAGLGKLPKAAPALPVPDAPATHATTPALPAETEVQTSAETQAAAVVQEAPALPELPALPALPQ